MHNELAIKEGPNYKRWISIISIIGILFFVFMWNIFVPAFVSIPSDGILIEIKKGYGARQVGNALESQGIIKSSTAFVALVSVLGDDNNIAYGTYLFKKPLNIIEAEKVLTHGIFGISPKKITIPEGFTNTQIADRLAANLLKFDRENFINMSSTSDGYLYPETYYFLPSDSESVILNKMLKTFDEKTLDLNSLFTDSSRTKQDIIIMASILEREVKSLEDKKIVGGMLWNRIAIGMPLQVDATLAYERDKDSYTLTTADLRADSPYNTYTRRGLPPTPISNPGYDAIVGALEPTESDYLYFLTDKAGKVYYAKTYAEHLRNKAKYFNK
jgi:UPF0755 protein